MKAIILAAGRGSRMKNLTDDNPKCLVTFKGETLLKRQLRALRLAGISDIAIVTGYKRECLLNYDLHEFHNSRWEETNMVSSLACASEWLLDSRCIVSYSDIFYGSEAVKLLMNCQESIALTYDPGWFNLWEKRFNNPLDDAENFRLDSNGFLTDIGGRSSNAKNIRGQYMGLLQFSPLGWQSVQKLREKLTQEENNSIDMTSILKKLIFESNTMIKAIPYDGNWGEVDSQSDLKVYEEQVSSPVIN